MTVEDTINDVLGALVGDRVYPDYAPDKVARPYITFQQMGGVPVNFMDPTEANLKNSRFRINVWDNSRKGAAAMAAQIESALRVSAALRTTVLTNPMALNDAETRLRGFSQDFSFWF